VTSAFARAFERSILLMDAAMGTMIQARDAASRCRSASAPPHSPAIEHGGD